MSFSIVGSVIDLITTILTTVGLPGLLALMAVESFGLPPLPSEVILPFTGFLVAEGTFSFGGALAVALAGGLLGSFIAYAVGRWWRHRIERIGIGALRLHPKHLAMMDRYFARRGEMTVGLARLVPVVRSYISYPAGTAEMNPVRFGVYTAIGLAPFAAGLLYAGVVLRAHWSFVQEAFVVFDYVLLAGVLAGGVYLYLLLTDRVAPGWPPRRGTRAPPS